MECSSTPPATTGDVTAFLRLHGDADHYLWTFGARPDRWLPTAAGATSPQVGHEIQLSELPTASDAVAITARLSMHLSPAGAALVLRGRYHAPARVDDGEARRSAYEAATAFLDRSAASLRRLLVSELAQSKAQHPSGRASRVAAGGAHPGQRRRRDVSPVT